jgi:hypothetical protein
MKLKFLSALLFVSFLSFSQEEEVQKPKKITMKGYLKDMASFNWYGDSLLFQNLIHNRLNFAAYLNKEFTVVAEIRSRIITGDFVRRVPGYDALIDSNNDYFDMSINASNSSAILNIMADRLYVQWANDDWEIKAGRQRINWGVNLAWNPNDWFNAYSFFDFDYEERPGSDALRISRYTGVASSVEVAAKMAKTTDQFVSAAMWKFNKKNYDWQFLAGFAQGDLAIGSGWAGNLGLAGFKGELSYFHKMLNTTVNATYNDMFLGAISVDYSFSNSVYLNGSVMFNSLGKLNPDFGLLVVGQRPTSVRSLSPYKWSSFVQTSYPITPLLNSGIALIYYPGGDSFFINPSITYSARQNLDLDLIGQMFFGDNAAGNFSSLINSLYVRLKWSF